MRYAAAGLAISFSCILIIVYTFPAEAVLRTDAPPPPPSDASTLPSSPIVYTSGDVSDTELVPTGTSSVPFFPRTIRPPSRAGTATAALPSGPGDADGTYTLLGLGVRTVSFLSIEVYVVGVYVATADLTALQAAFVREGAPVAAASTLIGGEQDALRARLLEGAEGERIWERVLLGSGVRSALRVVPTRATDFAHLRDGWERGINARVRARQEMVQDDTLGASVGEFKKMFGQGRVGRGEVMLLERGRAGELSAWVEKSRDGRSLGWEHLGALSDERVGRLVWLNYLAGAKVASEPARRSIVDGVLDLVGRPIGTVETKVV